MLDSEFLSFLHQFLTSSCGFSYHSKLKVSSLH